MSEHFRPEIVNYTTVATHNGRYRMRRVLPSNVTGQTITLAPTATQLLELTWPARTPFNPARTLLEYQLEIDNPDAGKYNYVHDHTVAEIESLSWGNQSGLSLVDLQYAANYLATARKLDTDQATFRTSDATSALYLHTIGGDNLYPPSVTVSTPNAYGVTGGRRVESIGDHEPVYVRHSAVGTAPVGGVAGPPTVISRSIPLSAFTHTALAMDRDMMFGEDLVLRIRISGHEKVAYRSDKDDDASAGVAGALNTITAVAGAKMTNICMRLAVQIDPAVEKYVRDRFDAGKMTFIFPYQYAWKVSGPAGHVAFQHNLTNQYGKKLKRFLVTAYNTAEQFSTAFDSNNMNAEKIDLYRTAMDSQPLQDEQVSCKQPSVLTGPGMDDFRENRHLLKGSVLDNSMTYYLNWLHVDSFSNPKREASVLVPEGNLLEGLDLTIPRIWSFSATAKMPLTYYCYGEFIRQVHASPAGPIELSVA